MCEECFAKLELAQRTTTRSQITRAAYEIIRSAEGRAGEPIEVVETQQKLLGLIEALIRLAPRDEALRERLIRLVQHTILSKHQPQDEPVQLEFEFPKVYELEFDVQPNKWREYTERWKRDYDAAVAEWLEIQRKLRDAMCAAHRDISDSGKERPPEEGTECSNKCGRPGRHRCSECGVPLCEKYFYTHTLEADGEGIVTVGRCPRCIRHFFGVEPPEDPPEDPQKRFLDESPYGGFFYHPWSSNPAKIRADEQPKRKRKVKR